MKISKAVHVGIWISCMQIFLGYGQEHPCQKAASIQWPEKRRCFSTELEPLSWSEARTACESANDGSLMYIQAQTDNIFIKTCITQSLTIGEFWIGASGTKSGWLGLSVEDEGLIGITNDKEPSCAIVRYDGVEITTEQRPCTTLHRTICTRNVDGKVVADLFSPKNWYMSKSGCINNASDMFSATASRATLGIILSQSSYWIKATNYEWLWSRGQPMEYSNIHTEYERNMQYPDSICLVADDASMEWRYSGCAERRSYICQYDYPTTFQAPESACLVTTRSLPVTPSTAPPTTPSTSPTVTEDPGPTSLPVTAALDSDTIYLIVGCVAAALIVAVLITSVLFIFRRRRFPKKTPLMLEPEIDPYGLPIPRVRSVSFDREQDLGSENERSISSKINGDKISNVPDIYAKVNKKNKVAPLDNLQMAHVPVMRSDSETHNDLFMFEKRARAKQYGSLSAKIDFPDENDSVYGNSSPQIKYVTDKVDMDVFLNKVYVK